MREFVFGPRRVNGRRLLCIPAGVMREAGLVAPVRVAFEVSGGRVLMRHDAGGTTSGLSAMVSRVGQVAVPRPIVDALSLEPDGAVYVRASDGAVELLPASRVILQDAESAA